MSDPTSEPANFPQTEPNAQNGSYQADEPKPQLFRLSDVLGDLRRDADAAHDARTKGIARGPQTGLPILDRELSGALAVGLHYATGNAGTGKTALCLQVAASCACPALFVTCEMAPVELLRRHTARVTKTLLGRLKSGEMRGIDAEQLARQAIEAAPLLAFADATRAPASCKYLYECAQIVRGDAAHLLIVVDSLHSWAQGTADGLNEYEALNAAVADLQRLALTLRCPILIVSERNRASMKEGGINAGAGTRRIEYGAETVIDLDREKDAREDGSGEVNITLRLSKNRHGAAGKTLALKFNGALQSFREA
jgi:replicative DNA helicase